MRFISKCYFGNRRLLTQLLISILTLTMIMILTMDLNAQEGDVAPSSAQKPLSDFQNRRQLNGHTFMPSRWVGQPFIAGWLRMMAGGGQATGVKVPINSRYFAK